MRTALEKKREKQMTKEQIWLLLEIHNLLADTDKDNNHYGFNLLSEFIERECFATQEEREN
jgi:hypothetical protein